MERPEQLISDQEVPRAPHPQFQHLLDTYASETNKTAAIWSELTDDNLEFRPHSRSSSVRQILVHQILSERRFFAEFIGLREPEVDGLLPPGQSPPVVEYVRRLVDLARPRLGALSEPRRGVLAHGGSILRRAPAADSGSSGGACSIPRTIAPRWACACG